MEHPVSHEDIVVKIESLEHDLKGWVMQGVFRASVVLVPLILAGFVWVWAQHSAQASFNADINARVQGNMETYRQAREAQAEMSAKLDTMYKFMREDAAEQRRALAEHMHGPKH